MNNIDYNNLLSVPPELILGSHGVIQTLDNCSGYYDADLIGPEAPLVGYAGDYVADPVTKTRLNYVGTKYYNFAMAEQWPFVIEHWAEIINKRDFLDGQATFLGAPMGGIIFAYEIARQHFGSRSVYAEKKVTALKTATEREKSSMIMSRHILLSGGGVWVVEDVVNNLSSAEKNKGLIEQAGAEMKGIICVINRSPESTWNGLPIHSVLHLPTEQYRQDDPKVKDRIAAGKVFMKPKDIWVQEVVPLIFSEAA